MQHLAIQQMSVGHQLAVRGPHVELLIACYWKSYVQIRVGICLNGELSHILKQHDKEGRRRSIYIVDLHIT